ncbi:MAG: TolC family protein [Bdellovibrionales bacterium]
MKQKTVIATFLASALIGGFSISNAYAQSVVEAVNAAISYNPQLEQVRARIGGAEQEENAVRSDFFPGLSVGLTGGRIFSNNATSRGLVTTRGAAYSGFGEVNASLQQPLFDGFGTLNRLRSSKSQLQSANLELQDVSDQIAFQTVQAYLNVLQARSILIRLQEQEKKVDDYYNRIKTNVEDGGADEAQLQQARDVQVLLNGFVADYNGQLRTAESEYIALTGIPPFIEMIVPTFDIAFIPPSIPEAIAIALSEHPALHGSKKDTQSADHDIDAEKALLYPNVLGELSYSKSDRREEIGGETEDRRALLRLNWDIETGGGQYARIKQRRYEHAEALAREKEIRMQIENDIRIAYSELDVSKKRLINQKERVDLNEKLFETFEAQFEGGIVDLLQLMQADNQLFNTNVEKIILQYRHLSSQFAVVASIGKLQFALNNGASLPALAEPQIQSDQEPLEMAQEVSADEPQE